MRSFKRPERIKVFIKDPNKKNLLRMAKEVILLWFIKKEFPLYYFKYLYRKDIDNYQDYLGTKQIALLQTSKKLHRPEFDYILSNKLVFNLFMQKQAIKIPELVSYNLDSNFFFRDKIHKIHNKNELISFLESVFEESKKEEFFFKPLIEYGGKGCFKLTKKNIHSKLEETYELLLKGSYIHTEVIKQHELINKIHGNSVNTLRLITLITDKNDVEIISAFMRFGVGDSVVDNASSGGFLVGINIDDGTLQEKGHFLPDYGGAEIIKHPDSGVVFKDFKIPFFREACQEIIKAVKIIPDRFIGWDVAITPEGPTIVETNCGPHMPSSDIAYGGLLKNNHLKKVLADLTS